MGFRERVQAQGAAYGVQDAGVGSDLELDGLGKILLGRAPKSAREIQEVGGVILKKVESLKLTVEG